MLSILDQQLDKQIDPQPRTEPEAPPAPAVQPEQTDYEIVLGRTQIASWMFVVVIAITVCSSLAYLVGKSGSAKKPAAVVSEVKPAGSASSEAAPPSTQQAAPLLPLASIVVPPKSDLQTILKTAGKSGKPLFAEPETGKVYIQMGAVERGMATILAEGLRSHGFDAFVAPGPSETIFRVLIGPLPDPDSFRQAKAAVDAIDLTTFARKYQN